MTVKQIQCLLAFLGYYQSEIDGIFGDKTLDAVISFQDDFGCLAVDGDPGTETQKALRHAVAYGMPERKPQDEPESDNFWDDIEFFDREEFRCKCGGKHCNGFPTEPKEKMVRLANDARKHFGKPGFVVSGLRCEMWNRIQGGEDNSQHMYGEACDLQIQGVSADDLLSYIQKQPGVRYAYKINGTNVHFDIPAGRR
jgi:hypothetical protein